MAEETKKENMKISRAVVAQFKKTYISLLGDGRFQFHFQLDDRILLHFHFECVTDEGCLLIALRPHERLESRFQSAQFHLRKLVYGLGGNIYIVSVKCVYSGGFQGVARPERVDHRWRNKMNPSNRAHEFHYHDCDTCQNAALYFLSGKE